MGTNYYLYKKTNFDNNTIVSLGCEEEVKRIKNGFLWGNKYYPSIAELNEEFYQIIHIGKSSYGWHFLLAIYPEHDIKNLDDWVNLFNEENTYILDEYDRKIPVDEMIDIIVNRVREDSSEVDEQEEVNNQNRFLADCGIKTRYNSYDDMLRKNSAVRGKNGLWAHEPSRFVTNTDGTYDYIRDTIFD